MPFAKKEVNWLKVVQAIEKSSLKPAQFYREEFHKFCSGEVPCVSIFYRHIKKTKLALDELSSVMVVRLPKELNETDTPEENLPITESCPEPEKVSLPSDASKAMRVRLNDGSVLEFFCKDPEMFALRCLAQAGRKA